MPILQWYPGHMTKARRLMAEAIPSQDVIVEVLDARMPAASANPVLAELRQRKPCVKVLSKSDLADPEVTRAWLAHLEARAAGQNGEVVAIALSSKRPGEARAQIRELCLRLTRRKTGPGMEPRVMVVGIPNVGKSTLINTLAGRKVANVGDEPAVTKGRQRVTLKDGMALSDNPGILWPKVDDEETSLRLALGGALPDSAFDYETVGAFAAGFLLERYPALLLARYGLASKPASPTDLLAEVGRRRGAIRKGGVVDLHKAGDVLVHDFRSGALGRISLERPPAAWRPLAVGPGGRDAGEHDPPSERAPREAPPAAPSPEGAPPPFASPEGTPPEAPAPADAPLAFEAPPANDAPPVVETSEDAPLAFEAPPSPEGPPPPSGPETPPR